MPFVGMKECSVPQVKTVFTTVTGREYPLTDIERLCPNSGIELGRLGIGRDDSCCPDTGGEIARKDVGRIVDADVDP